MQERRRVLEERIGSDQHSGAKTEADLKEICGLYHKRIRELENSKYDLEVAVRARDYVVRPNFRPWQSGSWRFSLLVVLSCTRVYCTRFPPAANGMKTPTKYIFKERLPNIYHFSSWQAFTKCAFIMTHIVPREAWKDFAIVWVKFLADGSGKRHLAHEFHQSYAAGSMVWPFTSRRSSTKQDRKNGLLMQIPLFAKNPDKTWFFSRRL